MFICLYMVHFCLDYHSEKHLNLVFSKNEIQQDLTGKAVINVICLAKVSIFGKKKHTVLLDNSKEMKILTSNHVLLCFAKV